MSLEFVAGRRLRAPDIRARFPIYVRTTTDVTIDTETALQDIPGLSLFLEAGAGYAVDGLIVYSASNTSDIKVGFQGPSGSTGHWGAFPIVAGSASPSGQIEGLRKTEWSYTVEQGAAGYNAISPYTICVPHGYIATSKAGLLQARFAQIAADIENATVRAGSWLRATRVA